MIAVGVLIAGPSLGSLRASRRGRRDRGCRDRPARWTGRVRAETISTTHSGSIPSAGPTVAGTGGGPAARRWPGTGARTGGSATGQSLFGPGAGPGTSGTPPQGAAGRAGALPEGGPPAGTAAGPAGAGAAGGFPGAASAGGARLGAGGGGSATVSSTLVRALESDASSYRWVAATMGSTNAATYELASGGEPVMAIGGFNNNGGLLSLAQFIRYVKAGDIHYYIASGGGGGAGPNGGTASSSTDEISSWVAAHYSAETIGGVTVYDLTK